MFSLADERSSSRISTIRSKPSPRSTRPSGKAAVFTKREVIANKSSASRQNNETGEVENVQSDDSDVDQGKSLNHSLLSVTRTLYYLPCYIYIRSAILLAEKAEMLTIAIMKTKASGKHFMPKT